MTLILAAVLLAGVVVLTPLSDRLRIPSPVLLTVFGLLVPLFPWTPSLQLNPDLILPVVLPPLLFAATQRATAGEFRRNARPILLLAVGLTVATTAAVAWTSHLAGLGWGAAWVLGAVVSPPDPVAATAVARRLRLPDRVVTVLEGEGMFNDATALVLYSLAVAAVVSGNIGPGDVVTRLLLAVLCGIAVGLLAGLLTKAALRALHDPSAETTVTVAMPFATYVVAEHVHGSGVLAVLTVGLFLRSYSHSALTSGGWLLGRAVWRYADYLITSVVFVLIGFELTDILEAGPTDTTTVALAATAVVVLVVVRFAWMFPAATLARLWQGRDGTQTPYGVRETLVVSWAGMRGVVTVAAVLALPLQTATSQAFPQRERIVFVGLVCVLVTLVVQGLTLAPLVKVLNVGADTGSAAATRMLRRRAASAALDVVRATDGDVPDAVRHAVILQYEGYLAAQDALGQVRSARDATDAGSGAGAGAGAELEPAEQLQQLLVRASEAERALVLDARRQGQVSADVADEVLEDIEARAVRDLD